MDACAVTPVAPVRVPRRRWPRWVLGVGAGLVLVVLLVMVVVWVALRRSLPQLEGGARLPGLAAEVLVVRDAQGIPTVTASNRLDLARATGFLHAQERFFQMDLLRRAAAGELSALLGPGPLEYDRSLRPFRLRHAAQVAWQRATDAERAALTAYAEGVAAGLAGLRARPPEYLLLRQRPEPWAPEDSFLVLHSMGLQLSDPWAAGESDVAIAKQALPLGAFAFYVRPDTLTPAALDDSRPPNPRLPSADEFDVRAIFTNRQARVARALSLVPGSNAWVVDGRRTGAGSGLLANDMHLSLGLPNVWYRMQFEWPGAGGTTARVMGVTLPGTPAMVVGSNGRVAWGFTAAQLDVSDQVLLETDPKHTNACRVGEAWRPFDVFREEIRIAGSTNVVIELPWSPWGPVGTNALGQSVSFRWAMQLPEAANFRLLTVEVVSNVTELLDLVPSCGLPWLNVLAADRTGNIGWTLGGRFPKRAGFDGQIPVSWADDSCRWEGWYERDEIPRVLNPPSGVLWSANHAALGTEMYRRLMGGDSTDNGARASQIRDRLLALTNARSADLLAIQLDDRALLFEPWQQRLLQTLDRAAQQRSGSGGARLLPSQGGMTPDDARQQPRPAGFAVTKQGRQADPALEERRFAEARAFVADWGGRAATNSVGYRLVRAFRWQVHDLLFAPVEERCRGVCAQFRYLPGHHAGVVEDLLAQQPPHLLPAPFATYDDLLLAAARQALGSFPREPPLAECTWGDQNQVRVQHPFGRAIPFLSRWLDLPARQLPGDSNMPRVQGRSFGASERLVVSPGRETDAIFHMPGGQSGHFLSPFYVAGHRDWEEGRPSPLLPGPAQYRLVLRPADNPSAPVRQ